MAYWPLWQASFGGLHATNASIRIIDATELAGLIRTKELSPVEIVQAHLDRIEAVYPQVNAIMTLLAADTLKAAKTAETAVVSGDELGAFHGVPFTIKDVVDTAGLQWGHVPLATSH